MITRPLTWDVVKGEEMWNAGAKVSEIARFAHVAISTVMYNAQRRGWRRRPVGQPRVYPCVSCGKPDTAVRERTRCAECNLLAKKERNSGRLRPATILEPGKQDDASDLDIMCYRSHKQWREGEVAAQLREARLALEHELELTKPKAGRPKKFRKGFMPQTFGKYAA